MPVPNITNPNDIVQLNNVIRTLYQLTMGVQNQLTQSLASRGPSIAAGGIIQGTHANRTTQYNPVLNKGCLYYEVDRTVWYLSDGFVWSYVAGVHSCALASIPTDLGVTDAGFPVNTTTYNHTHIWSGTAWGWGLGDSGSNYIAGHSAAPPTGWKLCNGSGTFTYERFDCTTAVATVPDIATGGAYLKFASAYATTIQAAAAPTGSMGAPVGTLNVNIAGAGIAADNVHTHVISMNANTELTRVHWIPYFRQ